MILGGRYAPGRRPAVVVVDLIHGFADPASPLGVPLDAVVAATRTVVDAARALDLDVIFTTLEFAADLSDLGPWREKIPALERLRVGSRWTALHPDLGRRSSEPLVAKRHASAFAGTHLAAHLAARSVDAVLVCGATTSGCVRATVVDAVAAGLRVVVPRECVGDRDAEAHAASLRDLDLKYADVVDVDTAVAYLRRACSASSQARKGW